MHFFFKLKWIKIKVLIKYFFNNLKKKLLFGNILEYDIFFDNSNYKINYIRKYFNKIEIKICKFYKYLSICNTCKNLLILSIFNFFEIYMDIFGKNN